MHTLDLDFHRPPRPSPLGWLSLLAGLLALGGVLGVHRQWQEESRILVAEVRQIESRLPRRAAPRGGGDEALAAARQTLEKAKLPWGSLFAALESADNQDVAVLAVLPDGVRGQVKIHAEARDLPAMLAYHRRLEQSGILRQVVLLDHESSKDAGATPVRFHISAAWGAERGRP